MNEWKRTYEEATQDMKEAYETQIQSLKEQLAKVDSEHASTLEEQRAQWQKQLEALQGELTESTNQLYVKRADITTRIAIRGERDELNEMVSTLQAKTAALEDMERLKAENEKLKETIQQMKDMEAEQNATMEKQQNALNEKDQLMKSLAVPLSLHW